VPLHVKIENREIQLLDFMFFILRYKFDLFEEFVIYLIYFCFFEITEKRRAGGDGL